MKIVEILAKAFDRQTGEQVGKSRWEEINLEKNKLFFGLKTIIEIKNAYETFWNELDRRSSEIVFVQEIKVTK